MRGLRREAQPSGPCEVHWRALFSSPHRTAEGVLWGPAGMTDSSVLVTSVRLTSLGFDGRTGQTKLENSCLEAPTPVGSLIGAPCPAPQGAWTDCSEPLPFHQHFPQADLLGSTALSSGLSPALSSPQAQGCERKSN